MLSWSCPVIRSFPVLVGESGQHFFVIVKGETTAACQRGLGRGFSPHRFSAKSESPERGTIEEKQQQMVIRMELR